MTRNAAYDSRGNITAIGGLSFEYDMADQPRTVSGTNRTGGAVSGGTYVYDGNLKRVKSVVNGKTIYNVYDYGGKLVHVDEATDGKETDYLHGMGQTLARIKNGEFTYLHPDHLGSPQTGTSEAGTVSFTEAYTPFGEALINAAANDNQSGFTGHIKDKSTGLNYMQARYYDPNFGRFLSIDPVGFSPLNPGSFGRYTYSLNDPVNRIDPNGEESFLISRPIAITGGAANHSFVVVVDVNKGYLKRYSYGPSGASPVSNAGKLVSHSGSGSSTDLDDASAMMTFFRDQVEASKNGIQATRIDASDESVIAAGEALNTKLGTIENPGENAPNYHILPGRDSKFANSNTAAVAIPNNAREAEGKPANQSMPVGTNNPGRNSTWSINGSQITGTRGCGSRLGCE